MRLPTVLALAVPLATGTLLSVALAGQRAPEDWPIHDENRPRPPVVTPGTFSTPDTPGRPPSDAVVLFDGKNLSAWKSRRTADAPWKVEDGCSRSRRARAGSRRRRRSATASSTSSGERRRRSRGEGQDRGNSGVFLMGQLRDPGARLLPERDLPDGQAAAVYGQYPPLVNACRPPGEWQSYDIVFRAPRFDGQEKLQRTARVTVLPQRRARARTRTEIMGAHDAQGAAPLLAAPAERLPLALQDHDHPVRYRNIWIRELKERP